MKQRIRDHLDRGNDVETGSELFNAMIEGNKPLLGVSVHRAKIITPVNQQKPQKIPNIRKLGEFEVSEQITGDRVQGNLQAWRYYGIGDGISLYRNIIEGKDNKARFEIINSGGTTAAEYVQRGSVRFWMWSSYIGHNPDLDFPAETGDNMSPQDPEIPPSENEDAIFEDSEENCAASFATMGGLVRHLNNGRHKPVLQIYKIEDYALATYVGKIEEIDQSRTIPVIFNDLQTANNVPLEEHDVILGEGWALREDKPRKRFSEDVKNWLNEKFDAGLTPGGRKYDPKTVAEIMKTETLGNNLRFPLE